MSKFHSLTPFSIWGAMTITLSIPMHIPVPTHFFVSFSVPTLFSKITKINSTGAKINIPKNSA